MTFKSVLINGTGKASLAHLKSIRKHSPDAQIVVAGNKIRHPLMMAKGANECIEYEQLESLNGFELALIANASNKHLDTYSQCKKISKTGLIIIEKPFCMPSSYQNLTNISNINDLKARIIFQRRLYPQIIRLIKFNDRIPDDKIQNITIQTNYVKTKSQLSNIEKNYNCNLSLALAHHLIIHELDLIRYISKSELKSISVSLHLEDHEDQLIAIKGNIKGFCNDSTEFLIDLTKSLDNGLNIILNYNDFSLSANKRFAYLSSQSKQESLVIPSRDISSHELLWKNILVNNKLFGTTSIPSSLKLESLIFEHLS